MTEPGRKDDRVWPANLQRVDQICSLPRCWVLLARPDLVTRTSSASFGAETVVQTHKFADVVAQVHAQSNNKDMSQYFLLTEDLFLVDSQLPNVDNVTRGIVGSTGAMSGRVFSS